MSGNITDGDIHEALQIIRDEYMDARRKFPQFRSRMEGYAILLEEVDELWVCVKGGQSSLAHGEAIQVAAMALAFMLET